MARTPRVRARLIQGSGPLLGASIVVTRPAEMAQALKRRIAALGGRVISLPGLVLQAHADVDAACAALTAAFRADIAVFVSPTAVKFAHALALELRFARSVQVCALGAATARALKRHGVENVAWPRARQDSEGLLALPPFAQIDGKQIAVIGAPGGRELLPETLRARGARVLPVHVYARAAPRMGARQLFALKQASAPLVTLLSSAEILANLRAALPLALFARLAEGDLVVSSERLADAARASLFTNVHVAASPAPADLVACAQIALARHRL